MYVFVAVHMSDPDAGIHDPGHLSVQLPSNRTTGIAVEEKSSKQCLRIGWQEPLGVDQPWKPLGFQNGPELRQDEMRSHTQPRIPSGQSSGVFESRTAGHNRGAANDALGEAALHGSVHSVRIAEVIGVDDQAAFPGVGRRPRLMLQ